MSKHEGHKIGTVIGQAGIADYCLDCSQVLESLTITKGVSK
jgi:hypothetical protein